MFNLGAFLTYAFVVTITPGPNNIISMALANKVGFRRAIYYPLGVMIGFFTLLIVSSVFSYTLSSLIPSIKQIMGAIGACYMLYLAYKIMKSKAGESEDKMVKSNGLLVYGITMQFMNPKAILFAITIISSFITPYFTSPYIYLGISLALAVNAFVSCVTWVTFGSLFKRFLYKYQTAFNVFMGLLLVYSAISITGLI